MFEKVLLMAAITAGASAALPAQDWFVRAGSQSGDGSQQKPFGDPWQAFERCQAGDAVHVAEGKYFGKLGVGMWEIPFDRVQVLGGYTADFRSRDPWLHPTQLLWAKDSKNQPNTARLSSKAHDVVIDGIVIDMRDENNYQDEQQSGRTSKTGDAAIYLWQPSTVRNCVVVNPGEECIYVRAGSTVENNVLVNAITSAIKVVRGEDVKAVAKIRNNTILFAWDMKSPGTGNYRGAGIAMGQGTNAEITGNLFGHCDNNAIHCDGDLSRSKITKNFFAMNLFSNLCVSVEAKSAMIDDHSMEMLEEVGLKACDGNEVGQDPLPLDAAWMDKYSQRAAGSPGKVVMDDFNQMRQLLGLPLMGTGAKVSTGVAPPYALDKALQLITARKDKLAAGAHTASFEVKFAGPAVAAAAKAYGKGDLLQWCGSPDAMNGKEIEMLVAVGGVSNVGGIPASYKKDEHAAVELYDVEGKGQRVIGFYRHGTNIERTVDAATGFYRGSGKPEHLYVVRGTALLLAWVPKAGFYIDSIERYEAAAVATARPAGRDWFVRAGSMGGDGSKEKPFRDPFQALEKCQSGDTVHVAEGQYFGKLKAGRWKIDFPYVALLGGYDKDFTERAPWSHPTMLLCPADFKGTRGGYTIEGDADHTGTVIDGFVFDKRLNNNYGNDGNLIDQFTDHSEHVRLNRPECVVRNCVFLNGAEGAITVANGQLVENNVFMNHVSQTVAIQAGHTPKPIVLRQNTILFSWERANRFGAGRGYGGNGITTVTGVHAVLDGNIIEFSDNNAITFNTDPKDVAITNNVFAQNLWAILYKTENIVDDANFAQLGEFGLKDCSGNQLLTPGIPLEQKWFDVYLNRTAYVAGKVKMDEWNQIREMLGEQMLATGGQAGTGRAPAYDYRQALAMVPKNPACKAGARPFREAAQFHGVARAEVAHDYAETSWDVARSADSWAGLDGKRVAIKIVIQRADNQYRLDDIKKEDYECYQVCGPDGTDSPGLPMACYVRRGTSAQRAMQNAKGYERGVPDEQHILQGVARQNRILIVEAVEKAD